MYTSVILASRADFIATNLSVSLSDSSDNFALQINFCKSETCSLCLHCQIQHLQQIQVSKK